MFDKHNNLERYFIWSNISLLHFQSATFDEFKAKYIQRATAAGFDKWKPDELARYIGSDGHYARIYLTLSYGDLEAQRNEYSSYCSDMSLKPVMKSDALKKALSDNPLMAL